MSVIVMALLEVVFARCTFNAERYDAERAAR